MLIGTRHWSFKAGSCRWKSARCRDLKRPTRGGSLCVCTDNQADTSTALPSTDGTRSVQLTRRGALFGSFLLLSSSSSAEEPAPSPEVGDCTDCVGEVNGALNVCSLESASCVSSQNDDQEHFVPPWMYEGTRDQAVDKLIDIATGGAYDPGFVNSAFGIETKDAAKFILGTTANFVLGKPLPNKPKRQKLTEFVPFDGKLDDRHVASDGSVYVRITFGGLPDAALGGSALAGIPIDAEFSFPTGDQIANVRASSREKPPLAAGELKLSFQYGVEYDRNLAGQKLEALRRALGWEVVPVISEFDPKFNNDEPLWFEKFYTPFRLDFQKPGQ